MNSLIYSERGIGIMSPYSLSFTSARNALGKFDVEVGALGRVNGYTVALYAHHSYLWRGNGEGRLNSTFQRMEIGFSAVNQVAVQFMECLQISNKRLLECHSSDAKVSASVMFRQVWRREMW